MDSSENLNDDFDIYEDLVIDSTVQLKNEEVQKIQKEVEIVRTTSANELKQLQKENILLKKNISILYKTAMAEISRKNREINELRLKSGNLSATGRRGVNNKRDYYHEKGDKSLASIDLFNKSSRNDFKDKKEYRSLVKVSSTIQTEHLKKQGKSAEKLNISTSIESKNNQYVSKREVKREYTSKNMQVPSEETSGSSHIKSKSSRDSSKECNKSVSINSYQTEKNKITYTSVIDTKSKVNNDSVNDDTLGVRRSKRLAEAALNKCADNIEKFASIRNYKSIEKSDSNINYKQNSHTSIEKERNTVEITSSQAINSLSATDIFLNTERQISKSDSKIQLSQEQSSELVEQSSQGYISRKSNTSKKDGICLLNSYTPSEEKSDCDSHSEINSDGHEQKLPTIIIPVKEHTIHNNMTGNIGNNEIQKDKLLENENALKYVELTVEKNDVKESDKIRCKEPALSLNTDKLVEDIEIVANIPIGKHKHQESVVSVENNSYVNAPLKRSLHVDKLNESSTNGRQVLEDTFKMNDQAKLHINSNLENKCEKYTQCDNDRVASKNKVDGEIHKRHNLSTTSFSMFNEISHENVEGNMCTVKGDYIIKQHNTFKFSKDNENNKDFCSRTCGIIWKIFVNDDNSQSYTQIRNNSSKQERLANNTLENQIPISTADGHNKCERVTMPLCRTSFKMAHTGKNLEESASSTNDNNNSKTLPSDYNKDFSNSEDIDTLVSYKQIVSSNDNVLNYVPLIDSKREPGIIFSNGEKSLNYAEAKDNTCKHSNKSIAPSKNSEKGSVCNVLKNTEDTISCQKSQDNFYALLWGNKSVKDIHHSKIQSCKYYTHRNSSGKVSNDESEDMTSLLSSVKTSHVPDILNDHLVKNHSHNEKKHVHKSKYKSAEKDTKVLPNTSQSKCSKIFPSEASNENTGISKTSIMSSKVQEIGQKNMFDNSLKKLNGCVSDSAKKSRSVSKSLESNLKKFHKKHSSSKDFLKKRSHINSNISKVQNEEVGIYKNNGKLHCSPRSDNKEVSTLLENEKNVFSYILNAEGRKISETKQEFQAKNNFSCNKFNYEHLKDESISYPSKQGMECHFVSSDINLGRDVPFTATNICEMSSSGKNTPKSRKRKHDESNCELVENICTDKLKSKPLNSPKYAVTKSPENMLMKQTDSHKSSKFSSARNNDNQFKLPLGKDYLLSEKTFHTKERNIERNHNRFPSTENENILMCGTCENSSEDFNPDKLFYSESGYRNSAKVYVSESSKDVPGDGSFSCTAYKHSSRQKQSHSTSQSKGNESRNEEEESLICMSVVSGKFTPTENYSKSSPSEILINSGKISHKTIAGNASDNTDSLMYLLNDDSEKREPSRTTENIQNVVINGDRSSQDIQCAFPNSLWSKQVDNVSISISSQHFDFKRPNRKIEVLKTKK